MSDWLKVMLEEIERKKQEAADEEAAAQFEEGDCDAKDSKQAPHSA